MPPRAAGEVLIFEDDFNVLNTSLWKHELTLSGEGNWEFELYTNNRTYSFVSNSSLNIVPGPTANMLPGSMTNGFDYNIWGGDPASLCTGNQFYGCERTSGAGGNILNPVVSARVRTAETFAFKYGRVEVVAKLPAGDWFWPAIWLLPSSAPYGTWPSSGEIDIMESRGNARGYPGGGREAFGSTLHYGPDYTQDAYLTAHAEYTMPTGDLSQDFHTYGLYWNESTLMTYIDSTPVLSLDLTGQSFWQRGGWANSTRDNPWLGRSNAAPFDQRFYLIINLAVGGTNGYFPDGTPNKPWSNTASDAVNQFWQNAAQWQPTWPVKNPDGSIGGGGSAFSIDSVRVWQTPGAGGDYAYNLML